jgi:DMSO reductase iron-sulfur subunit
MTMLAQPVELVPTGRRQGARPGTGAGERGPALLPLEAGEQYRFAFAMDACVGCHSCEVACAEQNDLPAGQAWRRVGEIEGGSYPGTRRFSLSMACNHCLEPTCLAGCPTNAYEKLSNGIVVHHADDCIGCQYCVWNCPYEVPVFDPVRRIVAKCDMCRPRIDAGQSPACVLACPTSAISVESVDVRSWASDHAAADAPGLPPSAITVSTTRIALPDDLPPGTGPANEHPPRAEHPHWPLIWLTLLTQLSVGAVAATVVLEGARARSPRLPVSPVLAGPATAAFVAGTLALGASLLHLGRPTRALKAMRNIATSWLSREVALFSLFSAFSFVYAAAWLRSAAPPLWIGAGAVAAGGAGLFASARLYLVPARPVWNSLRTPVSFFSTAAALGPLLVLLCIDRNRLRPAWIVVLVGVAAAGAMAQLAVAAHLARALRRGSGPQHQGGAQLLFGPFATLFQLRVLAAAGGLALLAWAVAAPVGGAAAGGRLAGAFVALALGELAGRYLFYVTVVPYRMAANLFARH